MYTISSIQATVEFNAVRQSVVQWFFLGFVIGERLFDGLFDDWFGVVFN